jgi:hypothetical protein
MAHLVLAVPGAYAGLWLPRLASPISGRPSRARFHSRCSSTSRGGPVLIFALVLACAGGAAIGIAVALGVTRLMSTLLFGVSATDAVSFSAAALAILSVTLVASFVPAWRATRADPLAALRHH